MTRTQEQAPQVKQQGESLPTVCVLCSHTCGLLVDVEDNQISRIKEDPDNPITKGYTCNKAFTINHYAKHKQRVTTPLKKNPDGSHSPVSWDQAISEIGAKLKQLKQSHGPQSLALSGVGGQANHMDAFYALFFLKTFGSPWWFSAYAQEKTQHVYIDDLMFKAAPIDIFHADSWNSDYCIILGTNPLISNRGEAPTQHLRQYAKEKTLVVVDPRVTQTAKRAKLHLQLKPSSDAFLLKAMIGHIVQNKLYDADFLQRYTHDSPTLLDWASNIDVDAMAEVCELASDQVRQVAEEFAHADSACIWYDLGIEQVRYSTQVSYMIRLLAALTGNIGNHGGHHFVPRFSPMPNLLKDKTPHLAPMSGIPSIPALGPFGMFSPNLLPEEIDNDKAERIRALIVEGSNPLLTAADSQRNLDALKKLEMLVVIEPAMTETARIADYVLPTPVGYEKWEWCTFGKRFPEIYAQVRPPVLQGPEQALPEGEIYSRLAAASGAVPEVPRSVEKLARRFGPSSKFFVAAVSIAALKARGNPVKTLGYLQFWAYRTIGKHMPNPVLATVWINCYLFALTRRKDLARHQPNLKNGRSPLAMARTVFERILEAPHGTQVAEVQDLGHLEDIIGFKDKRFYLCPDNLFQGLKAISPDALTLSEEFPLVLAAGERRQWNANAIQRDPQWRGRKGSFAWLRIHPETATELSLEDGGEARLATARYEATFPVQFDKGMRRDHVSIPHGYGMAYPDENGELITQGVNVNLFTDATDRDPVTGIPFHKHVPCRVSKVS